MAGVIRYNAAGQARLPWCLGMIFRPLDHRFLRIPSVSQVLCVRIRGLSRSDIFIDALDGVRRYSVEVLLRCYVATFHGPGGIVSEPRGDVEAEPLASC
jgi:hypothetical protein